MNPFVRLRAVEPFDLPLIFQNQLDADGLRMAVVNPRNSESFYAHWTKILNDNNTIVQAILADQVMVGYITCFPVGEEFFVGYWISKEYWGRGITTRALSLLLELVTIRPLHARVARQNIASIRVLERCGFVVTGYQWTPASEQYPECEEAHLKLL